MQDGPTRSTARLFQSMATFCATPCTNQLASRVNPPRESARWLLVNPTTSVPSRSGSLLLCLSADGRSSDDVVAFEGVVGQIIPWNFPMLMLAWKFGPALAMGKSVPDSRERVLHTFFSTFPLLFNAYFAECVWVVSRHNLTQRCRRCAVQSKAAPL